MIIGAVRNVLPAAILAISGFAYSADKLAVPDEKTQAAALKTIKEVFKEEYAKSKPEERQALAKKLLEQADQSKDDLPSRYVLCQEAADISAKAGDARTALAALDLEANDYIVDAVALKAKALETASRAVTTPDMGREFANCCLALADAAIADDNFAAANKAVSLAETAARNAKELALVTQAQAKAKEIHELQAEAEKVKASKETLLAKPDDPDANLSVGKFLCFVKGDWEKGLPLLAKGGDAELKAVAEKDFANSSDTKDQAAIGDMWWDIGEKLAGSEKAKVQGHAAAWYKKALPGLSGLTKAKAEKRIEAIAKLQPAVIGPQKEIMLDLGSGVKMEMVLIPAGKFSMGTPHNEATGQKLELPQHEAMITKPFYMGKYVVTQEQYKIIMGNNPTTRGDIHDPVSNLNWSEAQIYCQKFSQKSGKNIRLPIEAEWEYACNLGILNDMWKIRQMCYVLDLPIFNPQDPIKGNSHTLHGGTQALNRSFFRSSGGVSNDYNDQATDDSVGIRVILVP